MDYYSPFNSYFPDPYPTLYLQRSFPEHHAPFEHARHRISDIFEHAAEQIIRTPRADVRETAGNYYIDIELPGLESKEQLKLKWISTRSLLLNAHITRSSIDESSIDNTAGGAASAPAQTGGDSNSEQKPNRAKNEVPMTPVHLMIRERHIGEFARAFSFPVDIDREALTAKVKYGLLTITIPKIHSEKAEFKEIKVEHSGT